MDQFHPHLSPRPRFEGYYNNFTLPSGSRIILIISSVPHATDPKRAHMGSFTYVPVSFPEVPAFQREIWVEDITMRNSEEEEGGFELDMGKTGSMKVKSDRSVEWIFKTEGVEFSAEVTGTAREGREWCRGETKSTPEGWLVWLPLPLHWHVHSLGSSCENFSFSVSPGAYGFLDPRDTDGGGGGGGGGGAAYVHQEKNWAYSFPASHVWVKARRAGQKDAKDSGICIAGGSIIGTESYLISYHARDPVNDVSYAPPWSSAVSALGLKVSPCLSTDISWPTRTFTLTLTTLLTRLCVTATADRGTFVGLAAPFHDGHRENFLVQSFRATVTVKFFRRGLGGWRCVEESRFEGAGLEFGGEWYGEAGKGRRDHIV